MHILKRRWIAVVLAACLTACGGQPSEPQKQETAEKVEQTGTYQSKDGWTVVYDPSVIEASRIGDHVAQFVYTEDSAGTNMVTISYIEKKQPEEVLAECTESWSEDPETIERSEGIFPGTTDQWGYWRNLVVEKEGSGLSQSAIAGQYNGGVLLFEITAHTSGNDDVDLPVSDALAAIIDSITYEDFEQQTMYDYIPGTYIADEPQDIESVQLNKDHTGALQGSVNIDVRWGSTELMTDTGSYEYTIEGDGLFINMDDNWISFTKTDQASEDALPAYKYTGTEPYMDAICEYMVDENGKDYDKADVSIPSITIVYTDDHDPQDVLVYGKFELYNYDLEKDTLNMVSGGDYPGAMHLRKSGDGYEVTQFDQVADGSQSKPSSERIFGEHYAAYEKITQDEQALEKTRTKFIADYVSSNHLSVTQYRDPGWDPVKIAEM